MPNFTLARHRAAFGLVLTGSIALLGAQQVLGAALDARIPEATVDAHNMQPLSLALDTTVPGTEVPFVTSAVSTGQFEEAVKPSPSPTQSPSLVPTVAPAPSPAPAPELKLFESGIASTYGEGDGFEGNRTACGQVFHTGVAQIAHKSLPCGTLVRVEDTSTGNSVDARVTDRGPYVRGRIVDLSWGAFAQLHPAGPALLYVRVYLIDEAAM